MSTSTEKHLQADSIVKVYGRILADVTPVFFGLPVSLLPYSKIQIKDAIQLLITNIDTNNTELLQSLIQSYISLAQFVTNDELATLEHGLSAINAEKPTQADYDAMEQASFITSRIKADMETYSEELQLLLGEHIRLS